MKNIELDDKRREILAERNHLLVVGGPGSGKTTIALRKSQDEFTKHLITSQKILFLSFSRAAISRVADSAEKWLPKECLAQLEMQTFHSFFWSLIRSHGYLLGYSKKPSILLPHDEKALCKGLKDGDEGWGKWLEDRSELAINENRIAFDLFSGITLELLTKCNAIRGLVSDKYPLIIVDEAQDTDEQQWQCIKSLSQDTQLMVMADLEQQIYDFREGVRADRVEIIKEDLQPFFVDLGTQNNRSPDSEILDFGNSLLSRDVKKDSYKGVSRIQFQEKAIERDKRIRQSIGFINKRILDETGKRPESVAVLSQSNKGVLMISKALRGTEEQKLIQHKVAFDEVKALLASRVIAYLLEPKEMQNIDLSAAAVLDILADIDAAKGTITGLKNTTKWREYSSQLKEEKKPVSIKLVNCIRDIITELTGARFSGDPRKDWILVRDMLSRSKNATLIEVAEAVRYLITFNRGKSISAGLVEAWEVNGAYVDAMKIIEHALTVEQLHSDVDDASGIHVMTMHKAKGKQFDGVIILHEDRMSPLVSNYDTEPFEKSRKLLRVSVTRASKHVIFLTGVYKPPKILDEYVF